GRWRYRPQHAAVAQRPVPDVPGLGAHEADEREAARLEALARGTVDRDQRVAGQQHGDARRLSAEVLLECAVRAIQLLVAVVDGLLVRTVHLEARLVVHAHRAAGERRLLVADGIRDRDRRI